MNNLIIFMHAFLAVLIFATSSALAADGVSADRVVIEKMVRRLTLLSNGRVIKTYNVALGRNPVGPKEKEGDGRTPEGIYAIDSRNAHSRYHLSLHISYPNPRDIQRAKKLGVSPGGDITIHGILNGFGWIGDFHRLFDWTGGASP